MNSNRALLRRSLITCVIVGALLTVINHGDKLIRGEFNATMALQIGLTFLVPFVVASVSGAAALRRHNEEQHSQHGGRGAEQTGEHDHGAAVPE